MLHKVEGWATVFEHPDETGEVFVCGAFSRWLDSHGWRSLPMLHEHEERVGIWRRIVETPHGLWCEGLTILPLVARPRGLSVSFWEIRGRGRAGRRRVTEATLSEISLVRAGAQPLARLVA